jgi:CRP-like cAMP-binding protein
MSHRCASVRQGADPARAEGEDLRPSDISWEETADCRHCALRRQTLFSALRGSDFDPVFLPINTAIVPAGTVLYTESAPADAIYTVRWGLVKLAKQSPEGMTRIVRLLGTSAAVGLEGLKEGIYWHTATALQDTGLCRIPFKVVDQLQSRNAQLAERLVLQWERYVQYADRWITELSAGPVKVRLERLIELLIEVTASRSNEIEMPPLQDLAATLGVSVESVSRAMADLKRNRVLTRIAPRTYHCAMASLSC